MSIKYLPSISALKFFFPIIVIVVEFATRALCVTKPHWSFKNLVGHKTLSIIAQGTSTIKKHGQLQLNHFKLWQFQRCIWWRYKISRTIYNQEALDYHQCMLILQRIQEFETINMCAQIFKYVPQFSKKFQESKTTSLQDCCFWICRRGVHLIISNLNYNSIKAMNLCLNASSLVFTLYMYLIFQEFQKSKIIVYIEWCSWIYIHGLHPIINNNQIVFQQ